MAEALLDIDLRAIAENWTALGALSGAGTETAADSYDPFGRALYAGFTANF